MVLFHKITTPCAPRLVTVVMLTPPLPLRPDIQRENARIKSVSCFPLLIPSAQKRNHLRQAGLRRCLSAPTKVGFVSLGCPKNLVDSEVMMGMLAQAGAELTPAAEDADVIVVNTCSFIASAQQESVDTILEMARHKTGGKAKRLVVAGCLVERFRDEIQKNIPEVDAVVGTGELESILAAAGLILRARKATSDPVATFDRSAGVSPAAAGASRPRQDEPTHSPSISYLAPRGRPPPQTRTLRPRYLGRRRLRSP